MTGATPGSIAENLATLRTRMAAAARRGGRDPAGIRLVAVSKTQPAEVIARALAAGQREYGENYLQEAQAKLAALRSHREAVWHFIGAVQSNKTRALAENFDWVHTLARPRIAERLNAQRSGTLPPLQVCIEVNLSGEARKSGVAPEEVTALAQCITRLPRLKLRGLMTIPALQTDPEKQRLPFRRLRELFEILNRQGFGLDTLSMGMSADFEAAILEGATLVRVGSAIFGARAAKHSVNQRQPLS